MSTPAAPRSVTARLIGGPSHGQTLALEGGHRDTVATIEMGPDWTLYSGARYSLMPWEREYREVHYRSRKLRIMDEHPCVRHVHVSRQWIIYLHPDADDQDPVIIREITSVREDERRWHVRPPLAEDDPYPPDWAARFDGPRGVDPPGVIDFDEIKDRVWRAAVLDQLVRVLYPEEYE